MHVRLQTWLPLTIQVCINGREYLARQMLQAGISYTQADNCFTAIGDLSGRSDSGISLGERKWKPFLDALAPTGQPLAEPERHARVATLLLDHPAGGVCH